MRGFALAPEGDFFRFVNPTHGTGGHGHCTPAASVPFGAVQLGPDTGDVNWDHCSGYHFDDKTVLGFSHTHLSGTGVGDLLDFRVMPGRSKDHGEDTTPTKFVAAFSHEDEFATPGSYRLRLREPRVMVELTATERVGLHRYSFAEADGCLLLDLSSFWSYGVPKPNATAVKWARVRAEGTKLTGGRSVNGWARGRELYFAAELSAAPERVDLFADGKRVSEVPEGARRVWAVLHFKNAPGATVQMKLAVSGVDEAGAARNLAAEAPGWEFDRARREAATRWATLLGRVKISAGADDRARTIFYTGIYHALQAPTLFDDVDRRCRGMDGKVQTLAPGEHNYSTFSFWDTYRTLHPLLTLLVPERVPEIVSCIVRQGLESPAGVTVWPLQGKETACMDGYHSAPVVAEALAKGFSGIDAKAAWKAYGKRAMVDDYEGLGAYRQYGFVPCDLQAESVSKTCDYAYDDWAVATIAEHAGDVESAAMLRKRSMSYHNVFDKGIGFVRPKRKDGTYPEPYDPKAITITHKWVDYTEANGWQTTFLVQHDAAGLCEMLGGPKAFEEKLDGLFNASSDLPTEMMPPDVAGLIGQYAHGNEPSHHIAYLYNAAGAPAKAQKRVRQIMTELYHAAPDALAGNEDCGQMSAWFCMNALGFYPVDPVSATYDIGTPLFDKLEFAVGGGRTLTITAQRPTADAILVKRVLWNDREITDWKLAHRDLVQGGRLHFVLAAS